MHIHVVTAVGFNEVTVPTLVALRSATQWSDVVSQRVFIVCGDWSDIATVKEKVVPHSINELGARS